MNTIKDTNSCRVKFARRFIRSLLEIKRRPPININNSNNDYVNDNWSADFQEIQKRSQRIKVASYLSMAHAVGPRKAWTRAFVLKLQKRAERAKRRRRRTSSLMVIRKPCRTTIIKRKQSLLLTKKKKKKGVTRNDVVYNQTDKLREIVPGGKAMDICSLFDETAHYIKCLSTQVKVMQNIADQLSLK